MMLRPSLLRSIMVCAPDDSHEYILINLTTIRAEVEPEGIDGPILAFVGSIVDRSGHPPDLDLVLQHFKDLTLRGDPSGPPAEQRLLTVQMAGLTFLNPAAYRVELDEFRREAMEQVTGGLLLESATILKQGVTRRVSLGGGRYDTVTVKGVEAALDHIAGGIAGLYERLAKSTATGSLRGDADKLWVEYQVASRQPEAQFGVLSGLKMIDDAHTGLRAGDLALVLGFVSHMKSMFCMNWAYKAAFGYGKNVAVVPLEVSIKDLRRAMAVMHTNHPKFFTTKIPRISEKQVRQGRLTPEQETLWEQVLTDMKDPHYGQVHYKQPQPNVTIEDIFAWVETVNRRTPIDLVVIDYIGLVNPDKKRRGLDDMSALNTVIRQTKTSAGDFSGGRGVPVLSPFQANREGLKEAEKNGGRYTLRALSGANEAERSADFVYYVYLDQSLRDQKELTVGNLKARNEQVITEQFRVYADPAYRFIDELDLAQTLGGRP